MHCECLILAEVEAAHKGAALRLGVQCLYALQGFKDRKEKHIFGVRK